ncbi:hypothetical protein HAX54_029941 [Datura stramonium]|uniref:Uncharacterized protein n=1 Tax=Datura stramonium TaxID=4076 RepID=A0ABS8V6V4_DATST|nr:hypothetical protein [Datura stramonium]
MEIIRIRIQLCTEVSFILESLEAPSPFAIPQICSPLPYYLFSTLRISSPSARRSVASTDFTSGRKVN